MKIQDINDFINDNTTYSKYTLNALNSIAKALVDVSQLVSNVAISIKDASISAYHSVKENVVSALSYFGNLMKPTNTPEGHTQSAKEYNESAQKDWEDIKDYTSSISRESKHVFEDVKGVFTDGGNAFISSKAAISILYNMFYNSMNKDENRISLNQNDENISPSDDVNTFKNAAYKTLEALGYTSKIPLDVAVTLFDTLGVAYNGAQSVRYGAQYAGHKSGEGYHQACKMYDEIYNYFNESQPSRTPDIEVTGSDEDDWCDLSDEDLA